MISKNLQQEGHRLLILKILGAIKINPVCSTEEKKSSTLKTGLLWLLIIFYPFGWYVLRLLWAMMPSSPQLDPTLTEKWA